jgi:multicomponent Na+:H+ antiporter subunit C
VTASLLDPATVFGLCGAGLAGIGAYIIIAHAGLLRRIVGFNILGAGIFLIFGSIAKRGAAAGLAADPVPQALVITGIVVAFSATALAVALLRRLFELTGRETLEASSEVEQDQGAP